MNAEEIQARMDAIERKVLTTRGDERARLVLEHMRLKDQLDDLAAGRVTEGVTG